MNELIRDCPSCDERVAVELGAVGGARVFYCGVCEHEFEVDGDAP